MKRTPLVLALLWPAALAAQTPSSDSAGSTEVIPGAQFKKGGFHQWLFGSHYRDLWQKPLTVPELDLSGVGGGLTPTQRGGGKQTRSLRFQAKDGTEWVVRSLEKDPSPLLPPGLQGTAIADIAADQMSAGHPVGALVADPLLEAAGVIHAKPRLVRIPDDPRLGEFRADFGGMGGLLEQRPTDDYPALGHPELKGDVASTEKLLKRLDEHPEESLDTRAYLAARLMDLYLGDWDRHADQWRWLKVNKTEVWLPIPRDRDQAFARFDGLLLDLARLSAPQLVEFGPEYSPIGGLTWNARYLDRRFLQVLSWPTWDSIAVAVQSSITDDAITQAADRLPPSYGEAERTKLTGILRTRRDDLQREARRFYEFLAREADVHSSDAAELVAVRRSPDTLHITIAQPGKPARFDRHFTGSETKEVRLYLHGGADRVSVEGEGGGPGLHIIPGGGDDTVKAGSGSNGMLVSADNRGADVVDGVSADRRPFVPAHFGDSLGLQRDWGGFPRALTWFSYGPDIGLFLGGGVAFYDYGFRKYPYASRIAVRAGYSFGANTGRIEFRANVPRRNSHTEWGVLARASGIETVRFFGYGNETESTEPDEFYRIEQRQLLLAPFITFGAYTKTSLSFGPVVEYLHTELDDERLVGQTVPYGTEPFGQVGVQSTFTFDGRDNDAWPTGGFRFTARGQLFPELWDVVETYGLLDGEASAFLTPFKGAPTLALRAGGRKIWGEFPLHQAAVVGGARTVRGLSEGRYAGDGAVWGTAEARLFLTNFTVILPGQFGVRGAGDVGRVYFEDEDSEKWHTGVGGGIWISFLERANTFSVMVMSSEGDLGVYLRAGFVF